MRSTSSIVLAGSAVVGFGFATLLADRRRRPASWTARISDSRISDGLENRIMTTRIVGWILRATLRLAVPAGGRASATTTADPIPHGERLIGLAVVAFLVLALFA